MGGGAGPPPPVEGGRFRRPLWNEGSSVLGRRVWVFRKR